MENEYVIIKYLNDDINILKYISESNNQFNNRLIFMSKLEKKNINYKEALRLSKIWFSIKYKKCTFPYEIYNYVMQYDNL
jgi:hypothetical protein